MIFWEHYLLALVVAALVLTGLFAVGRGVERLRRPKRSRRIDVLESVMLAPQASVHLVRVGSRCMLLGASRERVTALGDVPDDTL